MAKVKKEIESLCRNCACRKSESLNVRISGSRKVAKRTKICKKSGLKPMSPLLIHPSINAGVNDTSAAGYHSPDIYVGDY